MTLATTAHTLTVIIVAAAAMSVIANAPDGADKILVFLLAVGILAAWLGTR